MSARQKERANPANTGRSTNGVLMLGHRLTCALEKCEAL